MSNFATIKAELQKLLDTANAKTGKADADLTGAVGSLVEGYGTGGSVPRVPACEVSVKVTNSTAYYYNHEQLPEIPEDVLADYPYVLIMRNLEVLRMYASKEKAYYWEDGGESKITIPSDNIQYTAHEDACVWRYNTIGETADFSVHGDGNWVVWWSNYDVPNGSVDSDEVYWYASEPQAEEPESATHFYYNGVRLPALPADVIAQYPCAWIRKHTTNGEYQLILSVNGFYLKGSNVSDLNSAKNPKYVFPIGDTSETTWTEASDSFGFNAWSVDSAKPCTWSNHGILNGSATATDIYFYGTLPVPEPA